MSEEKKITELKDEQLNKVCGGNGDNFYCNDWVEDPKYPIVMGYDCHLCDNCANMKKPEGPCQLGHPWFNAT